METSPITIRVFAAPMVHGASGETWESAATALGERLQRRFGGAVAVEFVELFSPRSVDFPEVFTRVREGALLPLVMIDDDVISEGGKLSEPRIRRALADRGLLSR